jgi:phosphatidylinositol alpha-1,6-mannosyltransferase
MIQCYQQCNLFILPNRTIENDIEGFGMVLVEAQACGKAVIAGDSGGTKETMNVGVTGCIVDCTDPANIANIVSNLISQPNKLKLMGKQGNEFVNAQFTWAAHLIKAKHIFYAKYD